MFIVVDVQCAWSDKFIERRRSFTSNRRYAPFGEDIACHIDGRLDLRLDTCTQTAAVIIEEFGLHANQCDVIRHFTGEFSRKQNFLEACLVHAHFLDAHEARHVIVTDQFVREVRAVGAAPRG